MLCSFQLFRFLLGAHQFISSLYCSSCSPLASDSNMSISLLYRTFYYFLHNFWKLRERRIASNKCTALCWNWVNDERLLASSPTEWRHTFDFILNRLIKSEEEGRKLYRGLISAHLRQVRHGSALSCVYRRKNNFPPRLWQTCNSFFS